MLVILALDDWQEDHEFKFNLGYSFEFEASLTYMEHCFKKTTKTHLPSQKKVGMVL